MTINEKLERFRATFEAEKLAGYEREHPGWQFGARCTVQVGSKYARVDIGYGPSMSGAYMVELATGDIYGIKGYGVIHRGHRFGNLDTIAEWDWSGYKAVKRAQVAA